MEDANDQPQEERRGTAWPLLAVLRRFRWGYFTRWAMAGLGPFATVLFRPLLPFLYLIWSMFWLAMIPFALVGVAIIGVRRLGGR